MNTSEGREQSPISKRFKSGIIVAPLPLTIKATQVAKKVDTIIILSGDADYVELVRHLKSEGVRVEIAAVPNTTASVLKEEADYFIPITGEDCFVFKNYK